MDATVAIADMMSVLEKEMKSHVERLRQDLGTMRTGRASAQILEGVKVEYYGALTPLKQVASITVPDARTIEIQPWDMTALEAVEKALQKADIGTSPVNNGKLIRLSLPPMTEDRRKMLVKTIKALSEDFKVKIRNERRDAVEKVKKSQKAGEIPEDNAKKLEQGIQKLTDDYIKKVDGVIAEKEKELLTV